MDNHAMCAFYSKLRSSFANGPMECDEDRKTLGKGIGTVAKDLMNNNSHEEIHVAVGYYSVDISPHIIELRQPYPASFLQFNMLSVDFLADMLLFKEHHDKSRCIYLFSKYRKIIDESLGNFDYANHYGEICQQFQAPLVSDYQEALLLAGRTISFLLFHEFTHTYHKLYDSGKILLHHIEGIIRESHISILQDEEATEEAICDYAALHMFAQAMEQETEYPKTILFENALYSLLCPPLYKAIYYLSASPKESLDLGLSLLAKRLEIIGIALICFQKYGDEKIFQDIDMSGILKNSSKIVSEFLESMASFWKEDMLHILSNQDIIRHGGHPKTNISPWILIL